MKENDRKMTQMHPVDAEALRCYREAAGKTRAEVGRAGRYSDGSTILKLEEGQTHKAPFWRINLIAEFLGLEPTDLIREGVTECDAPDGVVDRDAIPAAPAKTAPKDKIFCFFLSEGKAALLKGLAEVGHTDIDHLVNQAIDEFLERIIKL